MEEILRLIIYLLIYSFIGWILESTYKTILQKRFVNSGFLSGPFCPIYGFGALIMYLSLKDVQNSYIILFLFGMIMLSIFEYVVGLFLEIVFKTKYWDYSENKFNIHGRVCLKNSLYWGILGIIFMKVIHPFIEKIIIWVPEKYLVIFMIIGVLYLVSDTISTIVRLVKINVKLTKLENLAQDIKNRIEAINVKTAGRYEAIKRIQRVQKYSILRKVVQAKHDRLELNGLIENQKEIKRKIDKKIARMRRAFPTMKSEKLSDFLNNYKKS